MSVFTHGHTGNHQTSDYSSSPSTAGVGCLCLSPCPQLANTHTHLACVQYWNLWGSVCIVFQQTHIATQKALIRQKKIPWCTQSYQLFYQHSQICSREEAEGASIQEANNRDGKCSQGVTTCGGAKVGWMILPISSWGWFRRKRIWPWILILYFFLYLRRVLRSRIICQTMKIKS